MSLKTPGGRPESPYKTYDFRGVYRRDFTAETVHRIGRHLPGLLNARRVLVGRDARPASPEICESLVRGLAASGADVVDMGLATTPMVYHFTAAHGFDASVQVTASHNPPEYNGLKISRAGALPVGAHNGLRELEALEKAGPPALQSKAGRVARASLVDEFVEFLGAWKSDHANLRFAVDCMNGASAVVAPRLFGAETILLNAAPSGKFPESGPNPLEAKNRARLRETVLGRGLDLGVIFDGDGDRVMFLDETGAFVQPDHLIPVIARHFLAGERRARVVHDIRTSRGAVEALRADGAVPVIWKVGHVFLKEMLRDTAAVCGGELAGHYYFRDFHCCDSAEVAALILLGQIAKAKKSGVTFSQLVAPIRRHATTGEVNFKIERKDEAIAAVRDAALRIGGAPDAVYGFDGLRLDFPHWWVNVRKSNTEPCVRLILEAATPGLLATLLRPVKAALKPFVEK